MVCCDCHFSSAQDWPQGHDNGLAAPGAVFMAAAARAAGAPDDAITWMTTVTLEGTQELMRLREVAVILATGAVLNGSSELTCTTYDGSKAPKSSAPVTLEQAESSHILQTLLQTEGVVGGPNGAAARLGLPRTTLISKMRRLGINPFQTRSPCACSIPGRRWRASSRTRGHRNARRSAALPSPLASR